MLQPHHLRTPYELVNGPCDGCCVRIPKEMELPEIVFVDTEPSMDGIQAWSTGYRLELPVKYRFDNEQQKYFHIRD